MEQRRLAILGSTGTSGQKAVEIAKNNPQFKVEALTAHTNASLLIEQAIMLKPDCVVIVDDSLYQEVNNTLWEHDIKVYAGTPSVSQVCEGENVDMVVNAIYGIHGLEPTVTALNNHKVVAMACNEAIVCGSKYLIDAIKNSRGAIIPVDNQLNALFRLVHRSGLTNVSGLLLSAAEVNMSENNRSGKDAQQINAFKNASYLCQVEQFVAAQFYFGLGSDRIQFKLNENDSVIGAVALHDGTKLYCTQNSEQNASLDFAMHFPGLKKNELAVSQPEFESVMLKEPDHQFQSMTELAKKFLSLPGNNSGWKLDAAIEAAFSLFKQGKMTAYDIPAFIENVLQEAQAEPKAISDLISAHEELKRQLLS